MNAAPVLVLGASNAVGGFLLNRLGGQGLVLMAVSRRPPPGAQPEVIWLQHDLDQAPAPVEASVLISLGPARHALAQLRAMPRLGRVLALSSASTLFKQQSADADERDFIVALAETEADLIAECAERAIPLTLLKSAMIYGGSDDANVGQVAALAERLPLLPYCGRGLRHPVHADDIARLIVDCLRLGPPTAGSWLLGGGETLDYPGFLRRIAGSRGRQPRLLRLPAWLLRLGLGAAHACGRLQGVRAVMLDRQRQDLLVDDSPAREHLGWNPRPFRPG